MARQKRNTVEYFPHTTTHKRTIFVLEQKYGNDGYSFWFKLLEILGGTENHFFDTKIPEDMMFLASKTRLEEDICFEILDVLSGLNAIDRELWKHGVIWCQNFVDGVADVYKRRNREAPQKPRISDLRPEIFEPEIPPEKDNFTQFEPEIPPEQDSCTQSESKIPQSKVKERKVNTIPQNEFAGDDQEEVYLTKKNRKLKGKRLESFMRFWEAFSYKKDKANAADAWLDIPLLTDTMVNDICNAARKEAESRKGKLDRGSTPIYAQGWLSARRWEDEESKTDDSGMTKATRQYQETQRLLYGNP